MASWDMVNTGIDTGVLDQQLPHNDNCIKMARTKHDAKETRWTASNLRARVSEIIFIFCV